MHEGVSRESDAPFYLKFFFYKMIYAIMSNSIIDWRGSGIMSKYDVVIIGAGPAGIVEKGKPIEERRCPKNRTKKCVNCKPYCHITTGFSGAGAFSDGKLSLSYEVGGNLPDLIGPEFAQEMIGYTDKIYLEFGADTHVEGLENPEEVREIRRRAIKAGLKLVDCPIRHLGTDIWGRKKHRKSTCLLNIICWRRAWN